MKCFHYQVFSIISLLIITLLFGCGEYSSDFEQVGYYKKEMPNGSNMRVFSIFVKNFQDDESTWAKIIKYAKSQMYSERGNTFVFFFNDRSNTPDVTFTGAEFPTIYEKYCIAAFWKYPSGKEEFSKYPFTKK